MRAEHPTSSASLEVGLQTAEVEQAPLRADTRHEIDIAFGGIPPRRDRAEDAKIVCPAPFRNGQDGLPFPAHVVEPDDDDPIALAGVRACYSPVQRE